MAKNLVLWVVIALVLMVVFNNFGPRQSAGNHVDYSQFIADVKNGGVDQVLIEESTIYGKMSDGNNFVTYSPETDNAPLIGLLLDHGVEIEARAPENQG
ncbi:MAG: ATP-dependent metallopeptidase FtsH/Yme1/Tma family protein, partial [Pseudomonadota bacterium]|nr:ATP-dependent metallopeptidase FtsH/Yme1/Tma family protein [Pseudomonadota bacterium]